MNDYTGLAPALLAGVQEGVLESLLTCRNIGRNSRSCNLSTIVNADGVDQLQSGVWANQSIQINDRPVFPQKRTSETAFLDLNTKLQSRRCFQIAETSRITSNADETRKRRKKLESILSQLSAENRFKLSCFRGVSAAAAAKRNPAPAGSSLPDPHSKRVSTAGFSRLRLCPCDQLLSAG
jgi:hypothetical protein